ncbi:DUF1972 domain-containing protein [Microlunatus elymi]|uniref:DUF1972 domain-containing protein n=1 Tax=Microlunatus elymi TaxID=2596828 RepID=UPI00224ADB82|nr:DUF1972 domain-containing protein [Microlunatus elymi]
MGTHGVPAQYGGFETAAENVGLHLSRAGWRVIIYCQAEGTGKASYDTWQGIERVTIPVDLPGWRGTSKFDLLSAMHASRHRDVCLVFGYNTAVVNVLQRARGVPLVFNMDGIEWSRKRWGKARQAILYVNERIGCLLGHDLIADHPEIETYLRRHARASKITMIPYGADAVTDAPVDPLRSLGLAPSSYLTLICRPIPENSILEIVRGFSARPRGVKLAILGDYDGSTDPYHRAVRAAASDEVVFLGSIYRPDVTQTIRFHALGYLHGHTVGGTNPSLVEAMASGNPVIAHDNVYNRWVAGAGALYFRTEDDVDRSVSTLLDDADLRRTLSTEARQRHADLFTWEQIAGQYERLLTQHLPTDIENPASLTVAREA